MLKDFDSKGYVCPHCQRRYGALDVLPLVSPDGQDFRCADCHNVLADDEESMESKVSQERLAKLQKQTHRLVGTLKLIDNSFVPDNDFTSALASAIPPKLEHLNSNLLHTSVPGFEYNSNTSRTTTAALGVRIDYNTNQLDSAEDKARKSAQAQMNALPEWHLQSTVSGETIAGRAVDASLPSYDIVKDIKLDAAANDQVEEYYRTLRAQQLAQGSASENEEDVDEDDEDDDLEDIPENLERHTTVGAEGLALNLNDEDSEDEFEDV